jgi:uncharacterized membrane protein YkoI
MSRRLPHLLPLLAAALTLCSAALAVPGASAQNWEVPWAQTNGDDDRKGDRKGDRGRGGKDSGREEDRGREQDRGRGMSLDQAVDVAQRRFRARVVRADTIDADGRRVYVLRLLSNEDGRVWSVRVDAATGSMQ